MISVYLGDYIEHIAWFLVFAVGGGIAGGVIASVLFNGQIARRLFAKVITLCAVGYWLVFFTGYIQPHTVAFYWDRYGASVIDDLLRTVGRALG
ncbi:hypothetical protein MOQ67_31045 (plasmid) [Pseudomonas sp. LY-1]|jgi:hypothetical protein|uniref:Uncharacterized protein n=1 Tax=Pseudomonas fluorescens TaxID=294 RepID=A0A220ITG9_PSEFL|nr:MULTISPECIES: hypothetical protein [Pseudomonas]EES7561212.1 hypothetical protein [Escherichia coli]ASI38160.1 Hypothetical protein [Pseudomonas fluorescens]EKF8205630.1 hypothetical protein [Pseudomonas aeruginosa]EKI0126952.1 hypothetical protein [Pseudomonas aeruginosa]NNB18017.1 hypothetical protein [Pseudomonas fragi]